MRRSRLRSTIPILLASSVLLQSACAAEDGESATTAHARAGRKKPVKGIIEQPTTPYRVVAVTNGGSVVGHVLADGALPADTAVVVPQDASLCGSSVADRSLTHRGDSLGNVVVWIRDARQGRALPLERRFEVVHEGCVLTPRVQAAVAGGTVNVRNQDPMVYRLRAERDGSGDTITVFRMSDAGQVVPSERIAKQPGLVKLACDQHPFARGWIAVFDHPYFAVTADDGAFRIDSLPPGRYHLEAWHERAARPVEREIEVRPGGEISVDVKLAIR